MKRLATAAALLLATALPVAAQKQAPPEGGTPKDFRLAQAKTLTLPNGMRVTLVPYGAVPKTTMVLVIRAGNVHEGPEQVWLADLMGDLMEEGTTTRTAEQIANEAAGMGGSLNVNVAPDQMTVGGDVLAEFAPAMVRLMADVARNPSWPASELPRLKADRLRQLTIQKSQPQSMTLEEFRRVMYPDHPYGRVFPTEAMIQGYTVDDVKAFYAANVSAGRARLYVGGRFDAAAVEKAVREAFGSWAKGTPSMAPQPKPVTRRAVHLLDRPGAQQSTIYLGIPVIDPSHADYSALVVTNALLGGSFASRITSNIREEKGYTYSPFSQVSVRYRDGYWVQTADVTTAVTGASLTEIFKEIDRLQAEAPSADELKGIQNYLAGTFVLSNSSRQGILNQLSFRDLHGLPDTYLTDYVKRLYAVTPEEVRRIAQTYLRDEEMLLVVTGDRSKIDEQVKPFEVVP